MIKINGIVNSNECDNVAFDMAIDEETNWTMLVSPHHKDEEHRGFSRLEIDIKKENRKCIELTEEEQTLVFNYLFDKNLALGSTLTIRE